MNVKHIFISILLSVTLLLTGCASGEGNNANTNNAHEEHTQQEQQNVVTIKLTKDGEEVISEDTVEFTEGESLMEVMERKYELTTGYGGDFIVGINGLEADDEEKYAWLISVNNEMLMVGAKEYKLEENDVVQFDYAKWE